MIKGLCVVECPVSHVQFTLPLARKTTGMNLSRIAEKTTQLHVLMSVTTTSSGSSMSEDTEKVGEASVLEDFTIRHYIGVVSQETEQGISRGSTGCGRSMSSNAVLR